MPSRGELAIPRKKVFCDEVHLDVHRRAARLDDGRDKFNELALTHGDSEVALLAARRYDGAASIARGDDERGFVHERQRLAAEERAVVIGLSGEDHLDESRLHNLPGRRSHEWVRMFRQSSPPRRRRPDTPIPGARRSW